MRVQIQAMYLLGRGMFQVSVKNTLCLDPGCYWLEQFLPSGYIQFYLLSLSFLMFNGYRAVKRVFILRIYYLLIYLLTYLLASLLTYLLTYLLTHSLTHSVTQSLSHSFTHSAAMTSRPSCKIYSQPSKKAIQLNKDLLEFYNKARDDSSSGYMGRIKRDWDIKHPELNYFTAKNPRDHADRIKKK